MRTFFNSGPLFDKEGGGGGSAVEDITVPIPVEDLVPRAAPKGAEKSDLEKRFDVLENDNKSLKTRLGEAEQDARYWSQRARGEAPAPRAEEREPDDEPEPDDPAAKLSAEEILDVVTKEGMNGFKRLGFLTKQDLAAEVAKIRKETKQELAQTTYNQNIDNKFATEFPELLEDNKRVARGEKPTSEIFKRTSAIFKEMAEDDPALKSSVGAMLQAARMAKKEIALEKKKEAPAEREERETRRERIDNQRGERDRPREVEDETTPRLSSQTRQVIAALANHGVTEDDYAPRNGRVDDFREARRGR